MSPIAYFVQAVHRRLTRAQLQRIAVGGLAAAALAAIGWALAWRIGGYAAPRLGYLVILLLAAATAGILLRLRRITSLSAARFADRHFHLKDGLLSALQFENSGKQGEVYQLQAAATESRIQDLSPAHIPLPSPRRLAPASGVLCLIALGLALLPHSSAVRERIALEQLTAERTARIQEELTQTVEELIASLDEDEQKLLDPDKLRQMVERLDATASEREALKQIARFEQELTKAMKGLEARQDEAVLALAAAELHQSQNAEARKLGRQLQAKDFNQAAQELRKHAEAPRADAAKARERAKTLREMTKRMADGARQRNFGPMRASDGREMTESEMQSMQELLEQLEQSARELGEELEQGDGELAEAGERMDGQLSEFSGRLGKLAARQSAQGKLQGLRAGLGQARQFAMGRAPSSGSGLSLAQSNQAGGQGIGQGSVESRRSEQDEAPTQGQLADLKGNPTGQGPTLSSVESAESGTGVSQRRSEVREREYRQQLESLVHRDDIPESLKAGVREYFEKVHQAE